MDRKSPNTAPHQRLSEEELARRRAIRAKQRRRQERERRRREKRRKTLLGVMTILLLAAAAVLIAILFHMNNEEQREIEVQQGLQDMYAAAVANVQAQPTAETPAQTDPAESSEQPAAEKRISARFEDLYAVNPDLIGWIELGDTVNVPVVLRDNEYYMSRDFYGNKSSSGTVFADVKNADWENQSFMVLYGHNMREGIMFGKLDDLKEMDGFRRNTLVQFHTLYNDEVRYFLPFAVVDASVAKGASNYFQLRRFDIFNGETRDEQKIVDFVAEIMDRSIVEVPGIEVTPSDNILGLVTCSYTSDEARLMVFCREVRENEIVADMSGYVSAIARPKQ